MVPETIPVISINILSWNRKQDLAFVLDKIRRANYPKDKLEIIVVDNASSDSTPEMVKKDFPEVNLIKLTQNTGIAGWNSGFLFAQGKYIIVLDDDAYPEPDAFNKIADIMNQNPRTGILNLTQVKGFDGTEMFTTGTEQSDIEMGFCGGAAVIRRTVLERVGLYDTRYFYGHELDFGIRVRNRGFTVTSTSEIKVFHKAAGAYRYDSRYSYYSIRNKLWVTWKHFPTYAILISNTIWIIHDCLLSLRMKILKGFCLGIRDAFKGIRQFRQSRREIVSSTLTKRLLRRFSPKYIVKGIYNIISHNLIPRGGYK